MDQRLRELERRYRASNSPQALEAYKNEAARIQLIPSRSDLELMRKCGFVKGRTSFPRRRPADLSPRPVSGLAVPLAWGMWLHLMKQLVNNSFEWRRNQLYEGIDIFTPVEETYEQEHALDGQYETLLQHLDDLKPRLEPQTMIADMEYPAGGPEDYSVAQYINQYFRQGDEGLGLEIDDLYLHYNDVTGSALMGFMNNSSPDRNDHFKIYLTIRELRRLSDEDQVTLEADLEWNNGPHDRLPVFSNLPDCLWDHPPGTWCEWGYGDCVESYGGFTNYQVIDFAGNVRFINTCD